MFKNTKNMFLHVFGHKLMPVSIHIIDWQLKSQTCFPVLWTSTISIIIITYQFQSSSSSLLQQYPCMR